MTSSNGNTPTTTPILYSLAFPDSVLERQIADDPAVQRAAASFRAAAIDCLERFDAEGLELAVRLAGSRTALDAAIANLALLRAVDQARSALPPPPQRVELLVSMAGPLAVAVQQTEPPTDLELVYKGDKVVGTKRVKAN